MMLTAGRIAILAVVAVGVLLPIGISPFLDQIVQMVATTKLPLIPGGQSTQQFRHFPINITQRVYMFNITNYEGFLKNDELPIVEQLGPYTFASIWEKDLDWEGDQLLFRENKTFYFEPALSNGTLDDEIVTVDIVFMAALDMFDKLPRIVQIILKPLLRIRRVLCKHTVREFLYEGYRDVLADFGHIINPKIPVIDGKVGYLLGQNGSNDGLYSVYSGANNNLDKINLIHQFRNSSVIPYYGDSCNELRGTNGEMFPPFFDSPPESVELFSPLLCRPWRLYWNGTSTREGVASHVFSAGDDIFTKTGNPKIDSCYEKMPFEGGLKGTFDASTCQFGLPVVFSLPHFLHADPKLRELVKGLQPDPRKHDFFLSIFNFGMTTDLGIRVQINVPVRARPDDTTSTRVLYPVMWQELVFLEPDREALAKTIYSQAVRPGVVFRNALIIMGIVCALILVFLLVQFSLADRKSVDLSSDTTLIVPNEETADDSSVPDCKSPSLSEGI